MSSREKGNKTHNYNSYFSFQLCNSQHYNCEITSLLKFIFLILMTDGQGV